MVNHGKRIYEIAQNKGYNKSFLASQLNKTHQAVDYDIKRQVLKPDVLKKYASILQVDIEELQVSPTEEKTENWREKYFQSLEVINKLMLVVNENGIKVNFKFVISVPRVVSYIFLSLLTQLITF